MSPMLFHFTWLFHAKKEPCDVCPENKGFASMSQTTGFNWWLFESVYSCGSWYTSDFPWIKRILTPGLPEAMLSESLAV